MDFQLDSLLNLNQLQSEIENTKKYYKYRLKIKFTVINVVQNVFIFSLIEKKKSNVKRADKWRKEKKYKKNIINI